MYSNRVPASKAERGEREHLENMKHLFAVAIEYDYDRSYLKRKEYRVDGSSFPVAIARALRIFRKEVRGKRIKVGRIIWSSSQ